MKVVDIATEIFTELSEPASLSVESISYWLRMNVGELNNHLNTSFRLDESSEINNNIDKEDREPSAFNSSLTFVAEIGPEEKAVLKKMYMVHYYERQLRSTLGAASNDPVVEVVSDGSKVRKINKNELSKTYTSLKKQEYDELIHMINSYKNRVSSPVQVAGNDNIAGRYDSGRQDFNRL